MTRIPNVFLAAAVAIAAASLVAPSSAFGVSPPLRMMGVAVGNFAAPSKTTTALNLEDNIAEMYVLFPIFLFFFFLFFFRRLLFPPPCPCRYPTFFLLGSIYPARPSLTLPPPPCDSIASSILTQSPSPTSLIRPVRGPGTRRWLSTIP